MPEETSTRTGEARDVPGPTVTLLDDRVGIVVAGVVYFVFQARRWWKGLRWPDPMEFVEILFTLGTIWGAVTIALVAFDFAGVETLATQRVPLSAGCGWLILNSVVQLSERWSRLESVAKPEDAKAT